MHLELPLLHAPFLLLPKSGSSTHRRHKMSFYNIIDSFRDKIGRKYRKLHVFDFDGTLFYSPMPNAQLWDKDLMGYLGSELWYSNLRTLSAPCIPEMVDASWFDDAMLDKARRSIKDSEVLTVLMTGRRLKNGFRERIQQCLDAVNLEFDLFFCREDAEQWENTIGFKTFVLDYIIDECCDEIIEQLIVWDDRKSQINGFNSHFQKRIADWKKTAKANRKAEIASYECIEWHQNPERLKYVPPRVEHALVMEMIAEKRKTNPEINIEEYCSFTGIVLDQTSRAAILERFWLVETDVDGLKIDRRKWSMQNDHVTLFIGSFENSEDRQRILEKAPLHTRHALRVIAISPPTAPLIALKVELLEGVLETMNEHPHVTVAVAPGVQPKESNTVQDWIPVDRLIIHGTVQERKKWKLIKPPKPHIDPTPQAVSLGGLLLKYGLSPGPQIGKVVSEAKEWMASHGLENSQENAPAIEDLIKHLCFTPLKSPQN